MTIAHQKKQSDVEYLLSDPLKKAQQFSQTVEIGNFFWSKIDALSADDYSRTIVIAFNVYLLANDWTVIDEQTPPSLNQSLTWTAKSPNSF